MNREEFLKIKDTYGKIVYSIGQTTGSKRNNSYKNIFFCYLNNSFMKHA